MIGWWVPTIWIGTPVVDVGESIALHYASLPLTELWGALARDGVGPPLWPLVTHVAFAIGGVTGARLASVAVLGVGLTLAFRLTKRLFGASAAAAMALLLAGSPAWLHASSHAGDPLAPWLAESFAGLVLAEAVAAGRVRGPGALAAALALGAVTSATEPRAAVLLLAQLATLMPLTRKGAARRALVPTALGYALGALIAMTLLSLPDGPGGGLTSWPPWGHPPAWLAEGPRRALGSLPPTVDTLLTAASLAVAIAGWVAPGSSQWQARGLGLGGLVMPFLVGALLAASGLVRIDPRFLLAASTAATILAGRGLGYPIRQYIRSPAARVALTACLATALALPVAVPRLTARLGGDAPPYQTAARDLAALARSQDVVVIDAASAWVLPWLWAPAPGTSTMRGNVAALPERAPLGSDRGCSLLRQVAQGRWLTWDGLPVPCASPSPAIAIEPVDGRSGLAELLSRATRKWLVTVRPTAAEQEDPLQPWRRLADELGGARRLAFHLSTSGGTIDVARVDARYVGEGAVLTEETGEHLSTPDASVSMTTWPVFTAEPVSLSARATGPMFFAPSDLWVEGAFGAVSPLPGSQPPEWNLFLGGRHRIALGPPGSGAGLTLTPLLDGEERLPILATPRARTRIARAIARSGRLWVEIELDEASEAPLTVQFADRASGRSASLTVPPGERHWSPALGYILEMDPGLHDLEVSLTEVDAARLETAGHAASPLAAISIRLD